MSSSMQNSGVGRFVRDPELKPVGETHVCEFSLAIDEFRQVNGERKKTVSFLDFQIWDKAAELIVEYCKKGDSIYIQSTPRQDKWEKDGQKRSKIIFRVDNFQFLPNKFERNEY